MAQAQSKKTDESSDKAVDVIDPKAVATVKFGVQVYTFKRKRVDAMQFRTPMQEDKDAVAVKWLLGDAQYALFLLSNEDEDGCTSLESYGQFMAAIGEELGTGNS